MTMVTKLGVVAVTFVCFTLAASDGRAQVGAPNQGEQATVQSAELSLEAGVLLRNGDLKKVPRTQFLVLDADMSVPLKSGFPLGGSTKASWNVMTAFRNAPRQDKMTAETRGKIQAVDDFIKSHTITTITTDFDGKASAKLPPGDYFVFGTFGLAAETVLWNVPVHALAGANSLILDHNNAVR